tara:strand:+ start:3995 stop:5632 length:1638 start_codon:yes stop_codon:yes gene_type:complete
LELELYCFREGRSLASGGLGKFGHLKKAVNLVWPKTVWNPWLERQLESLCEYQWLGWTGCAASGKTYASSMYALIWWLADPLHSSVILTSTTAKMIRKRAWSNIQQLFYDADSQFVGNMVDSKTTLQARKGDDKNAIFAVAVMDGATSKAVANIQGIHSERILAIVDEATDTPPAAFEATSNLSKGCKEFQFLCIGNPHSKLDEHGRFCEPSAGWNSVSVETQEWETQRGACVRFDGMHSPNMKFTEPKWEFLITREQVRQAIDFEGESSPRFWKFTRGWWSPEGVVKTVLSETMCEKYHVRDPNHAFRSKSEVIAGLDPAFGGDRCVLKFAKYGDLENGLNGVEFTETVIIKINPSSDEPIHFQIAHQVKEACIQRGCDPKHLAVDSTGEGGGLCDIMHKEWSNQFMRVEFGGRPSEKPVSDQDIRSSRDAYANRVTELWFSVREWVIRDQVRGMDADTIVEFTQRLFDDEKRKVVVERKTDMKNRTAQSPDLADAAALIIEMAREIGSGHLKNSPHGDKQWADMARDCDSIYAEDNLYAEAEQ